MKFGDAAFQAWFWDRVLVGDGCWEWQGYRTRNGYGRFTLALEDGRRNFRAHRVAFELLIGAIPDGLQLDHLCRNRLCVKTSHLEPVTARENTMRGDAVTAVNARKTHCVNGHEFNDENTYVDRQGNRSCRVCGRERHRRRYVSVFAATGAAEAA